ncbi:MAG: ABC transporter substrate-binding protein [Bacillota bacterium]
MREFPKRLFAIWILVILFLLNGCSMKNIPLQPQEEEVEVAEEPAYGGEIVLPVTQYDTLNPVVNTNKSVFYLNKLIYDGLIEIDENMKPQPALADSWSTYDNNNAVKFILKNNVKWHDGQPFNAEDVRFTIDSIKQYKNSIFYPMVEHIKTIKILSSHEVQIEFDSPQNSLIDKFYFPILPKHKFTSSEALINTVNYTPVGTGKYKAAKVNSYKEIKLDVNENYWKDKPYIENIAAKIIPDEETALTSVEANEISMAEATNYDWEKYSENQYLKIYEYVSPDIEYIGFNLNKEILKDKRLRQAIAYGIDRHALVNEIYLGHATITDVPIFPHSWLYDEEGEKYGMNLEKAKQLLLDLNLQSQSEENLNTGTEKSIDLSLLVNNDNPLRMKIAELIAKQLKKVEININIQAVGWEEYQQRLFAGNYEIVLSGWHLSSVQNLSFAFHSSKIGSTNIAGFSDPRMDLLLTEVQMNISDQEVKQKYKEMQKIMIDELPYLPLFFKNNAVIVNEEIKGNINPKSYDIYSNIEQWFVITQ